ncbi:helix-turn-helix domain-containing protein [Streptomyces sp. NBC_00648]|uniref:helix-turn-helix domain-containing protein n=1 Tax=Streptomyces sp. NBC_00648 TaxID=2975797 RepID=UPI00324932CC
MSDDFLTVAEVVCKLKIGKSAVYDLLRTRRLPSIKVGRSRRIPLDGYRAYVASRPDGWGAA